MDSDLPTLDFATEFEAVEPVEWRRYEPSLWPYPLIGVDEPPTEAGEIGLDAQGRAVKARIGTARYVWIHEAGGVVELVADLFGVSVARVRRQRIVGLDAFGREFVVELSWLGSRAVSAVHRRAGLSASPRTAEYDSDGKVIRILRAGSPYWETPDRAAWPRAEGAAELVEPLAAALEAAVRDAARRSGVERPYLLQLVAEKSQLPPVGWLGSVAWRDHVRAIDPEDKAAANGVWRAERRGMGARLDLDLDPRDLDTCRMLSSGHPDAGPYLQAVLQRLVARLNADPLDGAEDPFIAAFTPGYLDVLPFSLPRSAQSARWVASLTSTADRGPAQRALTDRDALAALCTAAGLDGDHLAHEVAAVGLVLERGDGRSRLGGPGLLPPGTAWPEGLTFVAALDLAEVSVLDGDGWLLFFLGEMDDEGELEARVLHTDVPVEADGPTLAGGWSVIFRPVLTLPGDFEAGRRLGVDEDAYFEVLRRLAQELRDAQHWVGGHVSGIQQGVPEPGTVLLLHLDDDDALGFTYGDAGTVQFRSPAGDWSNVTASGESC